MALTPGTIVLADVATLIPDEGNVNTHSDEQLRQIEASIRDFGFNDPIGVCADTLIVIEGHGRLYAAKRMGIAQVPVLPIKFESAEKRRAYAIAHNRIQQLSPMDEREVLNEFDRIALDRAQYEAVGFTEDDVAFMRFRQEQEGAAQGGGGSGSGAGAKFAIDKSPTTTLQFTDQPRLFQFLDRMDWLAARYPDAITVAERITAFMAEFGGAL